MDFKSLWQEHQTGISRLVRSYEANPEEQQELMQEIGLAIWRALPHCRDESAVKAFVYRIAHNQAVNHVSYQVKKVPTIDMDTDGISVSQVTGSESRQQQALINAMRSLSLNQKQVISLLFEGFSYQQIAEITGLSASNVGALINRGKQKLQVSLNEQ
ncbi:RNA polymerase sigma factor [Thalassotalea ponticola]|uniref:RNA polymerase sigma factor n=1 Tax=Thalassotalea ponticola TaxID=1523392 RepID=UPI0025B52045|nr:RNA polymerase sigma factor [Thalassotalea ponticola]MDN3652351.1 RNA polymerase sigma factor [Thalassotalea ponticola]